MTLLTESNDEKAKILEEEQKPKNIALAIFRFRARRGTGVYYALLSTVPILVGILEGLSAPAYLILTSVGLIVVGILFVARFAGMKRFYQMRLVMGLFEQDQKNAGNRFNGLLYGARTILVTLMPLVAASVFVVTGNAILSSLLLIAFAGYVLAYYSMIMKQATINVLPLRVEDWFVALCPPSLLLFYFFQVIGTTPYLLSLLLVFLLAGIKSSYDAPQALVNALSDRDSFRRESSAPPNKRDDVNLSEIASGGALSSFTRIGIMLALLGVEQITFTDLLFAIKVSKSSLNHSVNALADAGYVTVRKGFEAAGGPRTFIRITKEGKKAIRSHLENMQTIASKFLN